MIAATGTSSSAVLIHPLVMLNITDHYTRSITRDSATPAVGVLVGTTSSAKGTVELLTSFDIAVAPGKPLDEDALIYAAERAAMITPLVNAIGWYTTGTSLSDSDRQLAKELRKCFGADQFFTVLLDPRSPQTGKADGALPIAVFESEQFHPVPFRVESNEAERIGVDAATSVDKQDAEQALKLSTTSGKLVTAANHLAERVDVVTSYLQRLQRGEVSLDRELLRSIDTLCLQLPTKEGLGRQSASRSDDDYVRGLLTVYLGVASHCTSTTKSILQDGLKKNAYGM